MIVHVLACDYDGTIAEHGRVSEATAAVLERVRASGRKLVLVTGRMLPDLQRVCPEADRMFDAIVAENGALLYLPSRREVKALGDAPTADLIAALRRHSVEFEIGTSILATVERFAEAALAAVRDAGVERTLVFNKGALMLLPGGVTKQTGLEAALQAMSLSRHNTVGIGDAENDHAFLSMCECAVAVADAIPALRDRADYVTWAPDGQGAVEFVEEHLLNDLAALIPRLTRHAIEIGQRRSGEPLTVSAHTTNLLIVGPSASGKSTLTGVLFERLVDAGRSVFLLDPEGDYQALAELPNVVVLGGKAEQALPTPEELDQLLRQPGKSLVLNLSAMSRSEKVDCATRVLGVLAAVRGTSGMPHWLIIDEAHHIFPADGSPAADMLQAGSGPLCIITLAVDDVAPAVWPIVNAVASTERGAFTTAVDTLRRSRGAPAIPTGAPSEPLERGDALFAFLDDPGAAPVTFTVARRRVQHRRHIRKYTEGELPPERSFFFRGAAGQLNLRAPNLTRFVELAEGLDDATWEHHLRAGDYSTWIRGMIKDPELADEIAAIEKSEAPPPESRRAALAALRRRYTV